VLHENHDTHAERLARLEARLDQLVLLGAQTQADLREHLAWQRRQHEQHAARCGKLEQETASIRTSLAWMKGLWAALQAAVFGWLGMK